MARISVKGQLLAARKAMGKRIQARRQEAGLTQADLAAEVGVGQEAVSRWEAGLVEIGTDDLRALGNVLQAPTGWFMEGLPPKPEPYEVPARRPARRPAYIPEIGSEEPSERPRKRLRRKGA
jgi:transcriptional regulator with XRE-family HTH domain